MALSYVTLAVLTIAHLAGLVAAILLLVRIKGTAAILATVAFGALFLTDIGQIARQSFLERLIAQQFRAGQFRWVSGGFDCCCGLLNVAAMVCLIIALWQAVSGPKKPAAGESSVESV